MSPGPANSPAFASPTFAGLGLPGRLVETLARRGIDSPFPIQAACIPDVLAGRHVLGRGKTGSGKTLAFGLPTLARLAGSAAAPKRPLALVLVPTRELAMQVNDDLEPLGRALGLRTAIVIGQASMAKQVTELRQGVHVLVATPGRLSDLIRQGACDLRAVEITVLDEADHMADMGFLPDVTGILDKTPRGAQRLLFSATLDEDVDVLVSRYLKNPVTHAVGPIDEPVETMDHHLLLIASEDKAVVMAEIANRAGRTIMFARTKRGVDRLAKQLAKVGVYAGTLHGGKRQNLRTQTLAGFRDGSFGVLIATDVAARGIHVDDVSLVVHVDPPTDHKGYLHRAGRTARAGGEGTVVTLALPDQVKSASSVIRKAGVKTAPTKVRAGDAELVRLTGARPPSGHPIPAGHKDARKGTHKGTHKDGRKDGGHKDGHKDGRRTGARHHPRHARGRHTAKHR
ncbi:MAG TPA: DEAD/DEAH box helicase [Streptosporangiaceae bacterium]|nr:DEAD/DEAH box helicase [Streptosporangiaceae bacterium]